MSLTRERFHLIPISWKSSVFLPRFIEFYIQDIRKHFPDVQIENIQPLCAHENGDVESFHGKLKKSVDQALLLRAVAIFKAARPKFSFWKNWPGAATVLGKNVWAKNTKNCIKHICDIHNSVW